MLDAYVIEEIKRREREPDPRRAAGHRAAAPGLPQPRPGRTRCPRRDDRGRGVVIIDYG